MTTITVTVWIDDAAHKAAIECVHPSGYTPVQIVEMIINRLAEAVDIENETGMVPATKTTHVVDPSWRFGYDEMD